MRESIRPILKNTAHLSGAQGAGIIARGIYAVVLARFLGPEDYGLIFYALGWYLAFIPFTSLGLWAVISHDVGQSEELGRRTIRQALALRGSLACVSAIVCGLAGWLAHDDAMTRQLLAILSFALLGRSVASLGDNIFNAFSASRYVFKLEAIYRPLEVLAGICVLLLGGTLWHLAVIHALMWWAQGAHSMALVRSRLFPIKPEWDADGIRRLLRKGSLLVIYTFLLVWFVQGPLILARHFGLGLTELGLLALLFQIFGVLSQVPRLLVAAALPILSRQRSQEGEQDKDLVGAGMQVSWLVGSLAALIGWAVGPEIVRMVFGKEFAEAGNYLGPVLYLLVPWSWANMLSLEMFSQGLLKKTTIAVVIGGLFFTLTFSPFTNAWALKGAIGSATVGLWSWVLSLYFKEKIKKSFLYYSSIISISSFFLLFINGRFESFILISLITILGFFMFKLNKCTYKSF